MSAPYLAKVLQPETMAIVAKRVASLVEKYEADCIVVRGLSGQLAGVATSVLHGIPLAVVRKESERSWHSGANLEVYTEVEGAWKGKRFKDYFIVDDLISSGSTVDAILETVHEGRWPNDSEKPITGECLGIILYHSRYDTPFYWHGKSHKRYRIFDISRGNDDDQY